MSSVRLMLEDHVRERMAPHLAGRRRVHRVVPCPPGPVALRQPSPKPTRPSGTFQDFAYVDRARFQSVFANPLLRRSRGRIESPNGRPFL
jgi:hypothetical protein